VKAGSLARYHYHQDEGHLLLFAFGEDWLIDSGFYNYDEKAVMRRYMRSRAAHNVPVIPSLTNPYAEDFAHRLKNWSIRSFCEEEDKPFVEMDIRVLQGVRQLREVRYFRDRDELVITDDFFSEDVLEREVVLHWHVPCDKTITIAEDNRVTIAGRDGRLLRLNFENALPLWVEQRSGGKQKRIFSFVSLQQDRVEPSRVLRAGFPLTDHLQIISRFSFFSANQLDPVV
jgi:hypothetical protein